MLELLELQISACIKESVGVRDSQYSDSQYLLFYFQK